jgi:hypothetical protein
VQWIHLGESNIGYILQLQQQYHSIGVQVGVKTGNYDEIGPYNSTITARMVTLYINHGLGPYILDYNYMIIPNVSVESMSTLIRKYNQEQVLNEHHLFYGIMSQQHFHAKVQYLN